MILVQYGEQNGTGSISTAKRYRYSMERKMILVQYGDQNDTGIALTAK